MSHWLVVNCLRLGVLISGLFAMASCDTKDAATNADRRKDYSVLSIIPRQTTLSTHFPATIEGQLNIEIRPKIEGYIEEIYVDEGAFVRKGQRLFEIMAPQYEQEVRTARANIRIAQADVKTAEMEVAKIRPLVEKNIISGYELEAAEFTLQSKQAALAQARATLVNAETNLGYTLVTSPIDGIVGIIPYRLGSLINSNTPQPLTTVSNIDRFYAHFSINEKQVLQASQQFEGSTTAQRLAALPPVTLVLSNGFEFPHPGRIEATSGLIDPATRSLRIRATFPNPERQIRSGSTGTIRIPTTIDSAILVPQSATYEIQGRKFVYKVMADETVTGTEIATLSNTDGRFFVVEDGLHTGDRIVLEGVAGLREGAPIIPIEVDADSVYLTER